LFEINFKCIPDAFVSRKVVAVDVDFCQVRNSVENELSFAEWYVNECFVNGWTFPTNVYILLPSVWDANFLDSSVAVVYGPSSDLLAHSSLEYLFCARECR
jgi:hypothetical protein